MSSTKHPSMSVRPGHKPRDPARSVPFQKARVEVQIRMVTDDGQSMFIWWPGVYHQRYYSLRRDGLPHTVSLRSDDEYGKYGLVIEHGFIRLSDVVAWRYQEDQPLPPDRMLQAIEEHIAHSLSSGESLSVILRVPTGRGNEIAKYDWSTEDHVHLGRPEPEPPDDYDGGTDAPFPHEMTEEDRR